MRFFEGFKEELVGWSISYGEKKNALITYIILHQKN
jgi:hypothetical protein